MAEARKVIRVVAAVVVSEGKYFATQRGYGEWRGYWEFPGGKIESGETPEEALKREIREELEINISVGDKICTVKYDYPEFHLSMDCFFVEIQSGELVLKVHDDAKWLSRNELGSVKWLPADKVIIEKLVNE